jgi:hypothetical protein
MDYYNHPDFYNIDHLFEGEMWKDVEGYEGYYQISNCGRAKSLTRTFQHNNKYQYKSNRTVKGIMLKQVFSRNNGYLVVGLSKNHKSKNYSVHSLVAKAFIANPENKPQVNHKTGDKTNNHYLQLEWNTAIENTNHAIKAGLRKKPKTGEDAVNHKITENQVKEIRQKFAPGKAKEFAKKYGISESNVFAIVSRKRWKYVF